MGILVFAHPDISNFPSAIVYIIIGLGLAVLLLLICSVIAVTAIICANYYRRSTQRARTERNVANEENEGNDENEEDEFEPLLPTFDIH